ncbi:MAG: hypothetical protein E7319_10375 [Clostridiales bacterium]|nr:hypothetical protein [Clostridiales bacterium]
MKLHYGDYSLFLNDGGIEISRKGQLLYLNRRPLCITVKTASTANEFYEGAYDQICEEDGLVTARGNLRLPTGSAFSFTDTYRMTETGCCLNRKVTVLEGGSDIGFSSKVSLYMVQSDKPDDYECFAPGCWYRHNEFAPQGYMGKDLDCEYFWKYETRYALPVFAMRNSASGETVSLSRWAADVTLRNLDAEMSENSVDPSFTIGSIGMSRPAAQTLNYMYYGFAVRKEHPVPLQGLSIDYVYPGSEGQTAIINHYGGLDFHNKPMSLQRVNHPVTPGFTQDYSVCISFDHHDTFQDMMRESWRSTYSRMRDRLFQVDNTQHFHNCMKIFMAYTSKYGDSYGLPFAAQLPDMDANNVSFQFGFVGQQPGIGYLLMRYGILEDIEEAREKGFGILDFWVRAADTASGLPPMCYNPNMQGFEPYPYYIRMLADGLEAILEAWRFLYKRGIEKEEYINFCKKAADWLVSAQNDDGSFYRAYYADGSIRMDSKSNTPSVIRFLIQMYLITRKPEYRAAAVKAGEWSYENAYRQLEFRGGTCDNSDIQDKEAGIYGIWGFLALYDLTKEERWLEAAKGSADYTETWTYAWSFPVFAPWSNHPFNKNSISGQSIIVIGGGADVYMAACSYTYYRLYLITKDPHYLDFAEFIDNNTRQANDLDGSCGYAMPGLVHESAGFALQKMQSHYHWLPWCNFVEAEPAARMYDTFGTYEVSRAKMLDPAQQEALNDIYSDYV